MPNFRSSLDRLFAFTLLIATIPIVSSADETALNLSGDLRIEPAAITLHHLRHPHSLIVTAKTEDGVSVDLTSQATYTSADESIAQVDLLGWVRAMKTGTSSITVEVAGRRATVPVDVKLPATPQSYSFRNDVMPVLSKGGCNTGACHGYSLGKNGFKLSLRGSDAAPDYAALTDEFFERRINRHHPMASLLLTKPTGDVPHQGGVRFSRDSLMHELLLGWIREGAQSDLDDPVQIESLRIFPENAVLRPGKQQQFQLVARYSDGSERDVTRLSIFNANTDRIASVDDVGLVTANELGETAIVARFERIFATSSLIVLEPNPDFQPMPVPENGPVDRFVMQKLNELKITPSAIVDDPGFLRRVHLDLIGVQPTPDELRAFLADTNAEKRAHVIDGLFLRPEFVDWWSLKWGDLLQNSRNQLSDPAVFAFREWIRTAIEENRPMDRFAFEILTSRGSFSDNPASAYFAISKDTDETLQRATQVFCGVRMLCARCHPHPFENWTQADYYGLHSFFNQVTSKNDARLQGVANAKSVILNLPAAYSLNPRSGQLQPPRFLGGAEPEIKSNIDRREVYALWLTSADNPHFARSITNRIWSYFFHRGIIDPVDDLRTTNPPINPELLAGLTQDFSAHGFNVRHLMRQITLSSTYQRSSIPNSTNAHDDLNFSHAIPRRLPAESLLDSLVQATGIPESFAGTPAGFTAAQLPDGNVDSEFLSLFGKPKRMEACECERDDGANMLQALHFINGKSILSRVAAPNGRASLLIGQNLTDEQLIEQLYLWSLARHPSADEAELGKKFIASYETDKRSEAAQDFMWALLNSSDFMLVH
ncbi:MAG: DUF1553 domain-containing protein [Planctomycetales bacterium]|nr:DUF1553 domain-containing protein [Planctomycetales bacterium]